MIERRNTRFHSNASIECGGSRQPKLSTEYLNDISVGGLSFKSDRAYKNGDHLSIMIPVTSPSFKVEAEVIWCKKSNTFFYTGVRFLNVENGFRIKTVEQLRFIEEYCSKVYFEEGRVLSCEQADKELTKFYQPELH